MDSLEKLFNFAIAKEEEAAAFYDFLASEANKEHIRDMFRELAKNELAHKESFAKILKSGKSFKSSDTSGDKALHLSNYLIDVSFDPNMDYQDLLILAMKREEKSISLYTDLSRKITDPELAGILLGLAEEETSHKAQLEEIYEKDILTED